MFTHRGATWAAAFGLTLFHPGGLAAQQRPLRAPAVPVTTSAAVAAPVAGIRGNIIKSVTDLNGGSVLPGDTLVYDISVTNTGPDIANELFLTDTIPVNATYALGSLVVTSGANAGAKSDAAGDDQAEYEAAPNRVRFRLGTGATATLNGSLPAGQSTAVRFRVVVNAGVANGTVIANIATVSWRAPLNDPERALSHPPGGNPAGEPTTVIVQIPDLTIAKSHTGNFVRGSSGTYSMVVTNSGSGQTVGTLTVSDVVPAGLTPTAATGPGWTCTINAQTVTCTTNATLAAGASAPPITLTVSVLGSAPNLVTNIVTVSGGGETNVGNNQASDPTTITGPAITDLTIAKTHTGNFRVGQNHTWALRVTNVGAQPFSGTFTLVDTLPAGITYVSGPGPCSAAGQVLTCIVTTPLPIGASTTANITVAVGLAAFPGVTNRVHVSSPLDGNPNNNTAVDPVVVEVIPDLAILKTATTPFVVGGSASYSLLVSNVSTGATTGALTVTDTLPAGLTWSSGTGAGWSCSANGQIVTCTNPGPLAAGASTTIALDVTVGAGALPGVTNRAHIQTPGDFNPANNVSQVTTPVTAPDLAITKAAAGPFIIGQTGTWNISITNIGTGPTAGALTFTDTLGAGTSFVSGTGTGWSCAAAGAVVTCTSPGPLAVAASTTLAINVSVTPAALPAVFNRAHIATPGDSDPTNNAAEALAPVISLLDLAITKTANGPFTVGANASYTLAVTNVSAASTTGAITITDVLPIGLSFVSGTGTGWTCSAVAQTVTCSSPGPLAGGASSNVTLTVLVGLAAVPQVINTATVSTTGDSNPGNDTDTEVTPVPAPTLDLAITKTTASTFVAGQPARYHLTVANQSSQPTFGTITVSDVLPAGLTFVSATGPGFICSAAGQAVTCTRAVVLPAGQAATITLNVLIGQGVSGAVTNTGVVSTPGDSDPTNDSSTIITPIGPGLDLAIQKSASNLVVGAIGSFTFTVSNVGTATTTGPITVTDTLPAGITFLPGTVTGGFTCSIAGQVVSCTGNTALAPGQSASVTFSVGVGNAAMPSITNTAHVKTPGDLNPTNDSSTITVPVGGAFPDIQVIKSFATPVVAGANATFRVTITNVGTAPTVGPITLTDVLQAGLTYVSGSGTGWTCSAAGQAVTCLYPAILAPNAITSVDIVVTVATSVTSLTNTAVGKTPTDPNPVNDTSTITTPVGQLPDLQMTKTANGTFTVGQPASYTLTVRNVGNASTTGLITVTDLVPSGLLVNGASGQGWTCSVAGQLVTCTHPGPLAPGGVLTITVSVTPTLLAVPSVTNKATVKTPTDPYPPNDDDEVTTPVGGAIDLSLTKQGPDTISVGQFVDYVLTVRNVGTLPTTGPITVTDTLPAGLTFSSATGPNFTCTVAGRIVTCVRTAPPLNPKESATITVTVRVDDNPPASVRNAACVKTPGDANVANDCSSTTSTPTGNVDLVAFKDLLGKYQAGQPGQFVLLVRNLGTVPASPPITVVDTLPAGMTYVSAQGTGWQCGVTGNIVTCIRPTALPPGAAPLITVTVNVTEAAVGRVTNCMSVRGTNETGSTGNNRSCVEVPVDGNPRLEVEKRVSRTDAEIGDVVDYTIIVRNTGTGEVTDALIKDRLPAGFLLDESSVRVNGVRGARVTGAPGPNVTIAVGRIPAGGQAIVTYRVRIGPGAQRGENENVAIVESVIEGDATEPARVKIRITGGVFDERGVIAGKVYIQCDCDDQKMQDAGEVGIPGVRVYLEDGTSAVTDVEGKYNFYNVSSRLHVVKVDRTTLPDSVRLMPLANRNAGDGYTRFVDLKAGELHRADFADGSRSAYALKRVLERRRGGEVFNAGDPAVSGTTAPSGGAGASAGQAQPATQRYAPLFSGSVPNEANSQLPVTPLRARALQTGVNPSAGGLVELRLETATANQGVPADGQTRTTVRVRALDSQGNPRQGRVPVTLEASLGRWLGTDIDGTDQGMQATLENGEGSFVLLAAAQPGQGEVRVSTPEASTTVQVAFVPVNRPMLVTGLVNARIDFQKLVAGGLGLSAGGDAFEESLRDWSFDRDSGETRGGARAALLLKGTVLDDRLLTLSYDSERDRGRTFFRDIRPDEFFPVYGDASIREFDAQSRRRFYARLDKGTGYTMFGDFQTTRADDRRMLSSYDRSLTGAVQHLEGRYGSATVFASQGRISQAVDEIQGRGISGPYALTRATGLINSERVEILVRDRNQPSVILSRTPMTRFADYTIEPVTGRILFRAPVPSADANLNPVSIRVTYETENGQSDAFWIYGVDASARVAEGFEVGGTFAKDDGPTARHQLLGFNATARLGRATTVFGEYARTENPAGATGDAQRIELRHQSAKLDGRLFMVRSDDQFSNQSSVFSGGRSEYGGRFSQQLAEGTRLIGEAIRTDLADSDARREGALLSLERQFTEQVRAELGYRYAKDNTPAGLVNSPSIVEPDRDVSAVRARVQWTLPQQSRTSLFGEVEQDVRDTDQRRVALGGEYLLANRARLYARHEFLSGLDNPYEPRSGDKQYTVFGVDADYLRNSQVFSEYRARDAFGGRDAEASIGLRNRWAVAPGLLVNTSFERVSPLVVSGTGSSNDALAVTGAVEWTRPSLWKSTARLEYRDAETGDNALASFGYARKLNRDWTLLGRTLWDEYDATQRQTRGFSQLGVAWRETDRNQWNALARYEHRFERLGAATGTAATRDIAHILAALVNYQPVSRFTLSGRYAARRSENRIGPQASNSTAQLLMGRGILDLNSRLDAGLISSVLFSDGFSDRRYGIGGELGIIVMKNLRIAGGYNIFGFTDRDLNTFGTTRKGPYLELGFKFDEGLFGIGSEAKPAGTNAGRDGGNRE